MVKNMLIENATLYYGDFNITNVDTWMGSLSEQQMLGLGKDSIKFEAKPEIVEYEFAGKKGRKIKDMEDISKWDISVEGDVLDFNDKVLNCSLIKKDSDATSTKFDIYVPAETINSSDYKNLLVVGNLKGKKSPMAVLVENTYNAEGLSFEAKEKDNAATKLKFIGSYLAESNKPPYKVILPKDVQN